MNIILPPSLISTYPSTTPLFYLAGPILGGGDWQHDCCVELRGHLDGNFTAAIPCRYPESHPLMRHRETNLALPFEHQLTWERHYMQEASMRGCLIFWLPCENRTNPRVDGKQYAQDTRGELGEWRGRLMYAGHQRIVVGADPGFLGLSQIQRNFNLALQRDFPIYSTLEDTVKAAIKQAKR